MDLLELDDAEAWGASLRSEELVQYWRNGLDDRLVEIIDERRTDDPFHEGVEALILFKMTEQSEF